MNRYCKICEKEFYATSKIFKAHCAGKKHLQRLPNVITVKAPFTDSSKIEKIHEYFKQFGNILEKQVTAQSDCFLIYYRFKDKKVYTKIVQEEHTIDEKELEITWKVTGGIPPRSNLIVVNSSGLIATSEATPVKVAASEATLVKEKTSDQTNTSEKKPEASTTPAPNDAQEKPKMAASQEANIASILLEIKEGKTFVDQVIILQQKLQSLDRTELEKNRKMIQSDLSQALAPMFPLHRIHFFGSSITGLDFKGSDLDLFLGNVRQKNKPEVITLKIIRKLIYKSKKFCDLLLISGAAVPIIKCIHTRTQICCDLNIRNKLSVANSELIKYYLTLDEKLRPLMITIKFWMDHHGLKKVTLFSGYALYLLVLFYLQVEYDLPTVRELQSDFPADIEDGWNCAFKRIEDYDNTDLREETLLGLVAGFFKFYSSFDFITNVICPFVGKPLKKIYFLKPYNLPDCYKAYEILKKDIPLNSSINIQDPFEHCRNVCSSVPIQHVGRFTSLCRVAYQLAITPNETQLLHKLLTQCITNLKKLSFTIRSQKDYDDKVSKEWFDFAKNTTVEALKKIMSCNINVASAAKPDEAIFYDCEAKHNVWDNRLSNLKNLQSQLPPDTSDFNREIAVSTSILKGFPQVLNSKMRLGLYLKKNPCRIEIFLQSMNKCKTFNYVAHYLQIKLTQWITEYAVKPEIQMSPETPAMIKKEEQISDETNICSDSSRSEQVNSAEKPQLPGEIKTEKLPEEDGDRPAEASKSEEEGEIRNDEEAAEPEEEEEDVPADFFDAFSNQDFMDGLDIIDAWDEESGAAPGADSKKSSPATLSSPEKRKKYRSRSPIRRRKRSRSKSKSHDKNLRRDPEKTKRDIHRDKLRCAKDKEQKLVSEKLKLVETGLVPPGTEMETTDLLITNEKRRSAGSSVDRSRKYSNRRSGSREMRKKYSRSPVWRPRNRDNYRRKRTSSIDSNVSERELWIRSSRKRTRSRSRDSPLRSKLRKHEEKLKKKSFLEEIRDKLNEVHPSPVMYNHPIMPQFANPNQIHPIPAPVPAPSQFFPTAQSNPGMQQYDQRFFIGDAYPTMNVGFNNLMNSAVSVPQVQMAPQPQVQQQQVSVHPITKLPIVQNASVSPKIQNETAVAAEEIKKQPTDDIDKLFADKKISLSDFLTITAKCEVQSSGPDHLQKKIKVISRCQDAIKAMSDDRKFTGRLSVKPSTEPKNRQEAKYQSPLRKIPIVRFQFTSPAKVSEEVDSFAAALDKVLQKIGILKETTDSTEIGEAKGVAGSSFADEDSLVMSLKASLLNVKTDVVSCEECKKRKLKQFADVGSQCVDSKETVSIGTQVSEEDITPKGLLKDSIAYLTPAQLLNKEKEKEPVSTSTATETKAEKKKIEAPEVTTEAKKDKPKVNFNKGRGGFRNKTKTRSFNNSFDNDFDNEYYDRGGPSFEESRELFAPRFAPTIPPLLRYPRHFIDNGQPGMIRMHQLREDEGVIFTDFNQPFRGRNPNRFGPRF